MLWKCFTQYASKLGKLSSGHSSGKSFSSSHVWMWVLDHKKAERLRIDAFELLNWCFWIFLEKILESPLDCKEIQPVHPKGDQSWVFIGRTDVEAETLTLATWCEELTHLKRPWCWERLKAGGEGDNRGSDGRMAPPTWWTWVWASSGDWSRTGKCWVLQSMGLQRFRHDWVTGLKERSVLKYCPMEL